MASSVYIPIDQISKNVPTKDVAVYIRSGKDNFTRSGTISGGTSGVRPATKDEIKKDQLNKQIQDNTQLKQNNRANEIEQQRQNKITEARINFQKTKDREAFRQNVGMANLDYGQQRVNAGLSTSFTRYGYSVGNAPTKTNSYEQSKITKIDLNPQKETSTTYEKRTINNEGGIPTTAYFDTSTGKKADISIQDELRNQERFNGIAQISTEKKSPTIAKIKGGIIGDYETLQNKVREGIITPIYTGVGLVSKAVGGPGNLEEARVNVERTNRIRVTTNYYEVLKGTKQYDLINGVPMGRTLKVTPVKTPLFPRFIGSTGAKISGVGIGLVEDVRDKPLKNVVLFVAGYGLGAGLKLAGVGATALDSAISTRYLPAGTATKLLGDVTLFGGAGLATYQTIQTTNEYIKAEGNINKGKVIGIASKDLALIGYGGAKGQAFGTKLIGDIRYNIAGRPQVLPIEDIGYLKNIPEVNTGSSVIKRSLFGGSDSITGPGKLVEGKLKSYKVGYEATNFDLKVFNKAGRFYQVSPTSFSSKLVSIKEGSSEFAGLYGAPVPATYFAKMSGESPFRLFGRATGEGTPTISVIENTKFTTAFNQKVGTPFVTGVKAEIETVLGQEYTLGSNPKPKVFLERTGRPVFVNYKGVKVPYDTYNIKVFNEGLDVNAKMGRKGIGSTSSGKGKLPSYSYLTPEISGFSSLGGSSVKDILGSSKLTSSKSSRSSYKIGSSSKGNYSGSSLSPLSYSGISKGSYSKSSLSPLSYSGSSKSSKSYRRNSYSPLSSGSSYSPITYGGFSSKKKGALFNFDVKPSKRSGSFAVELKRYGKFKTVGLSSSVSGAFSIGKNLASNTLGATFRVRGASGLGTPYGFYKAKGTNDTFIEKNIFRLSRIGEKTEIANARRFKL